MRCFTWCDGLVIDGISLETMAGEDVIHLGKHTRFWNHVCVGLFPKYPPEVFEQSGSFYVLDARLKKYKFSTSSGVEFVLAKPFENPGEEETRVLLYVDTCAESEQEDKGFWRGIKGSVQTLAQGIKVNSEDKRWMTGLVRMHEGDVLHISLADPLAEDYVVRLEGGELYSVPWSEYYGE